MKRHLAQVVDQWIIALYRRLPYSEFLLRSLNFAIHKVSPHHLAITRDGLRVQCDLRDFIQATIFHFGEWEPYNTALIKRLLKPGDTFVDVGANIGYFSLLASTLVGELGHVVAVEASPNIADRLGHNLLINEARNVRIVNEAASDKSGTLRLFSGRDNDSGKTTTIEALGDRFEAEVTARPLPEMLLVSERASTRLIKVDVEGAEASVVRGLMTTEWPETTCLLVEIRPEAGDGDNIFDVLTRKGYVAFEVVNDYRWRSYLAGVHGDGMRRLTEMPSSQADVLFTRDDPSRFLSARAVFAQVAP